MPAMTQQIFKTFDVSEAAAIKTAGVQFVGVETIDGKRFAFLFEPEDKARKASELFWRHELLQDPRQFSLALRDLKDHIFRKR